MHRKQLFIALLLLPLLSAAAGRHSSAPLPAAGTAAGHAAAGERTQTGEITAAARLNGNGGQAETEGGTATGEFAKAGEADPTAVDTVIVVDKVQVTAIKQGMVLRSQPVAAAIVGSRAIERGHVDALKNLSQNVPNFYVPDYGSRMTSSIYVRGLGARIDQPVMGLNIDNVPVLNKDNYDMELARRMVQGVDVWLNTPTRPLEASGTSGEKAVMNGVLQFSVLDGWWVEGYKKGGGWMLPMERTFENQDFQNEMDAELIYNTIEEEIAPLYYRRDENNVPHDWVESIKVCVADIAANFTTNRMLNDYEERFYRKLHERHERMVAEDFRMAREIAAWKRRVSSAWDKVHVVNTEQFNMDKEAILIGHGYDVEVVVDIDGLRPEDIGVEMILADQITDNKNVRVIAKRELTFVRQDGSRAFYSVRSTPESTGSFDMAIRVFPKNDKLPHRMDFALVKWA